jgi:Rieske Fe-S protein
MSFDRRKFLKIVGTAGLVAAVGGSAPPLLTLAMPRIPQPAAPNPPRSKLVWSDGSPVKASELEVNRAYVFSYPMQDTPAILINVGDEKGDPVAIPPMKVPMMMVPLGTAPEKPSQKSIEELRRAGRGAFYDFPGGVGPSKSIVAYSAVCQHFACTYPQVNFYPPGSAPRQPPFEAARGSVIFCRCHASVYDPYRAAAVLRGPAQRPLPFIVLEWDPGTDELYANGIVGNVITGKFCNTCGELVGSTVVVRPA